MMINISWAGQRPLVYRVMRLHERRREASWVAWYRGKYWPGLWPFCEQNYFWFLPDLWIEIIHWIFSLCSTSTFWGTAGHTWFGFCFKPGEPFTNHLTVHSVKISFCGLLQDVVRLNLIHILTVWYQHDSPIWVGCITPRGTFRSSLFAYESRPTCADDSIERLGAECCCGYPPPTSTIPLMFLCSCMNPSRENTWHTQTSKDAWLSQTFD